MMKLGDVIFAKEVSIKSNKLSNGQQREGISFQDWCQTCKRIRIVMNELMAEFWNKELLSKKKDYMEYLDMEWEDFAREKNLNDKMLRNIVMKVEQEKAGMKWLERRGAPLNST